MENLTRERAHDLCVEMWNDIAENKYRKKNKSFLIGKYKPKFDCFACELYKDSTNSACNRRSECPFSIFDHCEWKGSPYLNWLENPSREHAIAIADLFI